MLKKAIYGLKQALQAWYSRINENLLSLGFVKSLSESTLYVKAYNSDMVIFSLYVNDLLVIENNAKLIEKFKKEMMDVFEMTNLRKMMHFLGMEVKQDKHGVFIYQKKYVKEILKRFQMENCKPMKTLMNVKEKLKKKKKRWFSKS